MEKIAIDGLTFDGIAIPTAHTKILLIRGEKAHLGCGYFSLAPADFVGDRFCVVTGVRTFDDMLNARVVAVSSAAIACGVESGMPGREALLRMEQAQAAV